MNIILQETDYAETLLKKGISKDHPASDLRLLARYFYHEEQLSPEGVFDRLFQLLKDQLKDVSWNKWESFLESVVRQAKKYPLHNLSSIPVTQNELNLIQAIRSAPVKRLAFTLVCLAKYRDAIHPSNHHWVNYEYKDLFRMANISATTAKQCEMVRELKEAGYIKLNQLVDNLNLQVSFIDPNDSSHICLMITDFRNLGYEYLLYRGEKFFRCHNCGVLLRQRSHNDKYCAGCQKVIKSMQKTYWDQKNRRKSEKIDQL